MTALNEVKSVKPDADHQPACKLNAATIWKHVLLHGTTLAHLCIVAFTIYIVYISLLLFEFFNWHAILFSIGWMLFMTEGVLMISKDNIISRSVTPKMRVRFHWLLQVVAMAMSIAGYIIVSLNKDRGGYLHFQSWHGLIGLISLIFCIPTCASGLAALFNIELRNYIKPTINKLIHAVCGIATVILGGVAIVLSVHDGWFGWKTDKDMTVYVLCFITAFFGIAWSMINPIITFFRRFQAFFV